jgi:hypothetical protein
MLEYFTYKKVKKHQAEKKGKEALAQVKTPPPLIDEDDERFLERIVSAEGTPPPLPTRPAFGAEAGDSTGNASQMVVHEKKEHNETGHERRSRERSERRSRSHEHKDKGKGKENEKSTPDEKKNNRFSFLQRTFTKKVMAFLISSNSLHSVNHPTGQK